MTPEEEKRAVRVRAVRAPYVDPGYLMVTIYTLGVAMLVLLGWFGNAGAAPNGKGGSSEPVRQERQEMSASESASESAPKLTPDAVQQGELLLPEAEGKYRPAPMLSMDVDIRVSGIVARATVRQQFTNDSDEWVEALYVFPLPDESAVDHLEMRINHRVIIGKIQKKEEARQTYETAKKEGKKASLLSQLRPNIFTTAVANIGPGETIVIQIEYQQVVQRQDEVYSLRFPMVVGPRYTPASPLYTDSFSKSRRGDGEKDGDVERTRRTTQVVPGGSKIPVLEELSMVGPNEAPVNPVTLHVNLAAGMEISRIDSLYHGIANQKNEDNSLDIRFTGQVKADRDFVLEWEPEKAQVPTVTLFSEQRGDERYMLLMVMPPEQEQQEPLAREVVFILDTSGSMGGESIRQAKAALLMAVERMRPQDRFNVIEFNNRARALFPDSKAGSQGNIHQAVNFIDKLEAGGGTEIRRALDLALDGKQRHERIRQLVFLTDGSVSNEEELFTLINNQLGDSRLFTVGIGSAPNSSFMTRAATLGRGSYTFIGKLEEVREKMTGLFAMLEQPAVTNLQLTGADGFEVLPAPLPDLYQGEPLTVVMKGQGEPGKPRELLLSGMQGGVKPWRAVIDTTAFTDRPGIAVLWARKKIKTLMDSLASGADAQQVEQGVTELALTNHLVSRYTSLVAVEEKVSRPGDSDGSNNSDDPNTSLRKQKIKTNLPAGWVHDKVFAGGANTATSASLLLCIGLCLLSLSALLVWMQWGKQ